MAHQGIINVSHSSPCPICGKPDWCFSKDYGEEGILHYCARVSEPSVMSNGNIYLRKKTTKDDFSVYEAEEQAKRNRERFIEKIKAENPDWKPRQGWQTPKPVAAPVQVAPNSSKKVQQMVDSLPPNLLDKIYRRFFSLLSLESWHKEMLDREWGKEPGLQEKIFFFYPIVSIPPVDQYRKAGSKNLKRCDICDILVSEFGSLAGVPGFYQNNGKWTFSELSGIAFPIYNSYGEMIRIRVRDDHPIVSCNLPIGGTFSYWNGIWHWKSGDGDETGIVSWHSGSPVLVTERSGKHVIPWKDDMPKGEVKGKYKNFSSYKEVVKNNVVTNVYDMGCRSGSYCSLYCKKDDDFSYVYFTEGEKKGIVANMLTDHPVVSIPGVSCYSKLFDQEDGYLSSLMDRLIDQGMKIAVLAYDADKNVNAKVLRSEANATKAMMEKGIKVCLGEWNAAWGKGLDDILIAGIEPQLHFVK